MTTLLTEQAAAILAHKIVCSEQVKTKESQAARLAGCSMFELMRRAGEAAFQTLKKEWPKAQNIIVVAGNGNNAGDGYLLAKLALNAGMKVIVVCQEPKRELTGDAKQAQQEWQQLGGITQQFAEQDYAQFDVLVDALLGTGVKDAVNHLFQTVIQKINQSNIPVLAIDLPSGMLADTGQALPKCVKADATVTFIAIKPGLVSGAGKEYCGKLGFADLGVSTEFFSIANSDAQWVEWQMLRPLRARPVNAHKGSFGKLLCIGGNQGMPGAIRLSAEAALRCGVGLVKVFCHESSNLAISAGRPEVMLVNKDLEAALHWCTDIIIGPGLGQDDWAQQQFSRLFAHLKRHPKPLVIDADALNLLADKHIDTKLLDILAQLPALVLTPHPGEASRLLQCNVATIENNRYLASTHLAQKYTSICVLKGAGTIILDPAVKPREIAASTLPKSSTTETRIIQSNQSQTQCWVCKGGNSGMATAGMGDLLTGVIGAFLAQGCNAQQAAVYGVCAHAEAGDRIALQFGQRGMIASDLLQPLRAIVNQL